MRKFSNSLLALTTSAIVAFLILAGVAVWQRERTMPQVQPLQPSPSQARPEPTPRPTTAPTVQPSSDPTANWKTYRNDKYGFEIKYPTGWLSRKFKSNPGQLFGIVFYEKEGEEKSVDIQAYPLKEPIENFIKRAKEITSVKKLSIQGYPAVLLGPEGAQGGVLQIFKNDRVFMIGTHYTAVNIWMQMYPTFRFLD